MIASVNLDVSIVNVTNESMASWRKKGREREREREGKRERESYIRTCRGRTEKGAKTEKRY